MRNNNTSLQDFRVFLAIYHLPCSTGIHLREGYPRGCYFKGDSVYENSLARCSIDAVAVYQAVNSVLLVSKQARYAKIIVHYLLLYTSKRSKEPAEPVCFLCEAPGISMLCSELSCIQLCDRRTSIGHAVAPFRLVSEGWGGLRKAECRYMTGPRNPNHLASTDNAPMYRRQFHPGP